MKVVQPNRVFHLAAAGVSDPFLDVRVALRVNLDGTLNLLRAVAGSAPVIVARTPGERAALNVYATSKAAAWQFCRMYHRTESWPIIGAMIFSAYGAGQNPRNVIPSALAAARAGRDFPMSPGEQQRDWVAVTDVVAALVAIAAASDNLRLVFLPNPNSPSGTMIPPSRVAELADALPCTLLVDEAYADFAEENCLDLVAKNEKIMVSRTLSKSYALAGLRFGFLIAQPQMIEQLMKVKDSYNCDALSIAAATAAIDDQAWLAENRAKVLATRDRLMRGMRDLGFTNVASQANFIWNTHPERPLKPLYEGLKDQRILVRYMDYPDWGDGLRISVGTDDQIDACLGLLKTML
ncbi:MAG: aminotransferase class I/II-fold pyridoxal phosphate-dependent enzyme [Planctomycetes bacterium]|nr:aminotransferase class I/II-fold pyridoxal phosphate-dependent enzyme [Planctomycetota bacterium]